MVRRMQILALSRIAWLVGLSTLAACTSHVPQGGAKAASGETVGVLDLENRPIDPFRAVKSNAKTIVFVFVRTDCPISNRYAPEIERLHQKYTARGVAFWLVYPETDTISAEIASHAKEYRLSLPVLRDPSQSLVKKAGVRVTPEVAVFSGDGTELYRGRIDDRVVDFGKERAVPTQHDLDDALAAILAHQPVRKPVQPAIGCYLSRQP